MAVIFQIDAETDPGFSYPGHSAGQKLTATQLASLASNAQMDTDLPAAIAAKDKPSLTVNDMVYALRATKYQPAWNNTPGTYAVGDVVAHLGKFWYCNATAAGTDVPGTSNKWTPTGAPHIS